MSPKNIDDTDLTKNSVNTDCNSKISAETFNKVQTESCNENPSESCNENPSESCSEDPSESCSEIQKESEFTSSAIILPILFIIMSAFAWICIAGIVRDYDTDLSDSKCASVKTQLSNLEKVNDTLIFTSQNAAYSDKVPGLANAEKDTENEYSKKGLDKAYSEKPLGEVPHFASGKNGFEDKNNIGIQESKAALPGTEKSETNQVQSIVPDDLRPLSEQLSFIIDYIIENTFSEKDTAVLKNISTQEREFNNVVWNCYEKKLTHPAPSKVLGRLERYFDRSLFNILGISKEKTRIRISIGRFKRTMVELELLKSPVKKAFKSIGPMAAIIIDDLGYGGEATRILFDIPPVITLAVLPAERCSALTVKQADSKGFELMLHQPMEASTSKIALGPAGLWCNMNSDEIIMILTESLDKFPRIAGVNNHMGSKFTADQNAMDTVMGVLENRGLYFIDSRTSKFTVAEETARKKGVLCSRRHVFLDNSQNPDDIRKQLELLMQKARDMGRAVGIGHAHISTAVVLKDFIKKKQARDVRLVKVSELLKN